LSDIFLLVLKMIINELKLFLVNYNFVYEKEND